MNGILGRGAAVRTFRAPEAGRYTVTAAVAPATGSDGTLAVGEDLAVGTITEVLDPAVLACGVFVLAGLLAATPFMASRRAAGAS